MNRSIFQILKGRWSYNLVIAFIFCLLLNWNLNTNCFSIKNVHEIFLKELQYKGILFKCSIETPNEIAFQSIDNFLFNNYKNNLSFSILKYYKIDNNIALPFNKYSCYSHPNLFLGTFNNLYWNLQFSHYTYNSNFINITDKDVMFIPKKQYICTQLYIYDSTFKQQFLNFDDLNKNTLSVYKNENPILIQKYINQNNFEFNKIVNKALKI